MNNRKSSDKPTLLLADDHAIVVEGLCHLLQPEFEMVGTVGDGWALLNAAAKLNPDVIVAHATIVARAVSQQTNKIPTVFTNVSDPLGERFVKSFAQTVG